MKKKGKQTKMTAKKTYGRFGISLLPPETRSERKKNEMQNIDMGKGMNEEENGMYGSFVYR